MHSLILIAFLFRKKNANWKTPQKPGKSIFLTRKKGKLWYFLRNTIFFLSQAKKGIKNVY